MNHRVWRNRERAIALMTALLVIMFLTMLTATLIKTQSGSFALMRVSDKQRDARLACRSLYDFCLYQLEHNRNWGLNGFTTLEEVDPARSSGSHLSELGDRIVLKSVKGDTLEGHLRDENLDFRIRVSNALTTGSGLTTNYGVQVRTEEVSLQISVGDSSQGSFRPIQTLSTILELAPLFDASVLTRGDLMVEAEELFIASKDPRRNEIRSQGASDLPGLTQGSTRFLDFDPKLLTDGVDSRNAAFDGKGLLYSGGDVLDEGRVLDGAGRAQAAEASGGRIVSQGSKRVDIYDLKPENIPQPSPSELSHDIQVPPGEFRFSQVQATVIVEEERTNYGAKGLYVTKVRTQRKEIIDVCSYFDPPGSEQPLKVMRGEVTIKNPKQKMISAEIDPVEGVHDTIPVEIGSKFYLNSDFDGSSTTSDGKVLPELGIRSNKNNGSGPVVIDLQSQAVQIEPNTRVRPKPRPEGSSLPPSAFELNVTGGQTPKFILGSEKNDVIFDADGDIKVGKGLTSGLGTLISRKGNVELQPNLNEFRYEYVKNEHGFYELKRIRGVEVKARDNYDGLVLYAGKDVTIRNPDSVKWTFRGFVYANGRFDFDVGGEDAVFFGSVVSRGDSQDGQASFSLKGGKKLGFIYDPEYLKQLTRGLPHGWTRLQPLVWNTSDS